MLFKSLLNVSHLNFMYKTLICDKMKQFGIRPDRAFIAKVEESLEKTEVTLSYQVVVLIQMTTLRPSFIRIIG